MIERFLVSRVLAGDAVAAERLVQAHYPRILRFLRHLTGSAADAEDLAQLTFIKAKEALPRFKHGSSLSTWLHRIAYHEFTHFLRDRRSANGDLSEASVCFAGRSEDAVVLAAAIQELPEEMREVFILREVQQLSVREVGQVLELPEGTVKSRAFAARERLRERLAGTYGTRYETERNGSI